MVRDRPLQIVRDTHGKILHLPDNVFCVVEDPVAPMRRDWVEYAKQNPDATPPTHFRHTFPTLSPPLALEQLLTQLRARWVPVRHTGPSSTGGAGTAGQKGQGAALATGAQLTVEGRVYAIGSDWLVRAGNVIISPGGGMKGMLLEVRLRPLFSLEMIDSYVIVARLNTFHCRSWRPPSTCSQC